MRKMSLADAIYDHPTPTHAPDGGWGWVVVFSSFMVNLLVDAVSFTFGIFFPEFLRHFGEGKGRTQLLHSTMFGTFFVLGPVASALVNKFGCRRVAGSGAVIVSVGLFLSSFSPNLDVIIIFYSIAGGIGFSLLYLPSIVVISSYFDKRRALATGMAVCGAGVGGIIFAPLSEFLLETYAWRGTLWIVSAIILNGVIFSATYRPLETDFHRNIAKSMKANNMFRHYDQELSKKSDLCCHQMCLPINTMFDLSLLKSPTMLLYGASCFLVMFGLFIPSNFLPVWASDVNLSTDEGALLILFMGVSNTVTRVLVGYITNKPWANSLIINSTALLIGGVSTCFVPFYTTFASLAIYAVVFGAVIAAFTCLRTILMAELLGVHRLTSSFGLVGLSMGLSVFAGSPIVHRLFLDCDLHTFMGATYGSNNVNPSRAPFSSSGILFFIETLATMTFSVLGALSDMSGDYKIAFYFSGITLGLGGLICLPLRRISEWEKRRSIDVNTSAAYGVNEDRNNVKLFSAKMRSSTIYTIPEQE